MQLNEERNQFENISILCLFVCWFLIQFGALAFYSIDYDHTFAPGTQTTATAQSLLSEWVKCVFVMFSMQQLKSSYENINMQMIIVLLFLSLVEYEYVRGVCAWAIRISLLSSDCWNRASAFQSAECFYYGVMFSDFMFFFLLPFVCRSHFK